MTGPTPDRPDPVALPTAGPDRHHPARGRGADRTGDAGPTGSAGPPKDAGPAVAPTGRRSGLRNPEAAVRGLGAGTLGLEALVLLLAIQPIRVVGGDLGGAAIAATVALAVAAVLLAGLMRRRGPGQPAPCCRGCCCSPACCTGRCSRLGVIFALVWAYALHVRRVILG